MKKAEDELRPRYKRADFAKLERGKFHSPETVLRPRRSTARSTRRRTA